MDSKEFYTIVVYKYRTNKKYLIYIFFILLTFHLTPLLMIPFHYKPVQTKVMKPVQTKEILHFVVTKSQHPPLIRVSVLKNRHKEKLQEHK